MAPTERVEGVKGRPKTGQDSVNLPRSVSSVSHEDPAGAVSEMRLGEALM